MKRFVLSAAACAVLASVWMAGSTSARAQSAPAPDVSPSPAAAQSAPNAAGLSPEELQKLQEQLIKTSQNPVGNISVIPFQNNFNYGYGPYQRLQYVLNVQPVVPFSLGPDANLVVRMIVPLIDQPSPASPAACAAAPTGCPWTFGLGDVDPQIFYAPKTKPDAVIWGAGAQFLFPTGTPSGLSAGQYGVGPAFVALIMPGNIVTGVLITQMFSVAGDITKPAISQFFIQPFFNYNLKDGWALFFGSSGITANWVATPQQGKWLVPIGTGVTKTFKLGDQPMQLGIQYFGNVVRPVNTPFGTVRFTWSLLFPIKRGLTLP